MKVGIILVGTELLNGDIVDTNSQYIQNFLLSYGMDSVLKVVVKDQLEEIVEAIKFVENKVDLLIMSGGLGPTFDDITRDAIAKFYSVPLCVDEKAYEVMSTYFQNRKMEMPENNIRQVMLPKGCQVVENHVGVAPGFYIGKILALQGVPRELVDGLHRFIESRFEKADSKEKFDILLYGAAESIVEDRIIDIIKRYESEFEFEILARPYGIILRVVFSDSQRSLAVKVAEEIEKRVEEFVFGHGQERLESVLLNLLDEAGVRISVAESCTGGLIAASFTAIPGSSKSFEEGIVTYSNQSKSERLGVCESVLARFGAVSQECVKEMLKGLKTPVKIAVSGIAGPAGGTKEKPVGLVYIGIEVNGSVKVMEYYFGGERVMIQNRAKNQALFEVIKLIKECSK